MLKTSQGKIRQMKLAFSRLTCAKHCFDHVLGKRMNTP
jgi:hypothetical protein